jgi:CHAT domain
VPVLSIRHHDTSRNRLAELTWTGDERVRASVPFSPEFDRFDLEDVRWYHENYRQNWRVSSNSVVERIRRAERNIGETLHAALFDGGASPLADRVRQAGPDLRIEIRDEVYGSTVPWELMADPNGEEPLALTSSSFVRAFGDETAMRAEGPSSGPHRLLLLISRPAGGADVGYWSVAYGLWRELERLPSAKVDVLRPPTFDELERRLDEAAQSGAPYAAVHFDGHATIVDPFGGTHPSGYLMFETAGREEPEFIDGPTVGRVLAAASVLLFSMNACRSADSEGGDRHLRVGKGTAVGQPSIVEAVLGEGVPSCIGMRQEIYPGTAVRFYRAFYPEFFGGRSAGEAAKIARGRLREEPLDVATGQEEIAPVDDWSIPVVGERAVVRLRSTTSGERPDGSSEQESNRFPAHLSAPSIVGFDRSILWLEDTLAEVSVVLIHGQSLSGKSRLAVEYAKWLSATSPAACPVRYVDLSTFDLPDAVATRMLPASFEGAVEADPARCADLLKEWGGVLILDQADRLSRPTEVFLGDVVSRLDGGCRILVTARADHVSWLPEARSVIPDVLSLGVRYELGRRWADAMGASFEMADFHPLLYFSGGRAGMIPLLLGASHELVSSGEASAHDIAYWLHNSDWDRIARLASEPGFGLPPIEALIDEMVGDLSSTFDGLELALIGTISRFNVCCDEGSVGRLMTAISGTEMSEESIGDVMERLAATGLADDVILAFEPAWFLHPLLKLVASRLPETGDQDDDALQSAMIDTMSRTAADLVAWLRSDTIRAVEMLANHKQNMSDCLYFSLEREQLEAASHLAEGLCLHCRFEGDVNLLGRVLDHALPYFIDPGTGALRPECGEIGLRVWDQAIWLSPDWPRNPDPMRPALTRLMPPEDDHYAAGLWFRAIRRMDYASAAFLMELEEPARDPRYAPGDIECQLSEIADDLSEPETALEALRRSRQSYDARLPRDLLGRASSCLSEARIRMQMVMRSDEFQLDDPDVYMRIVLTPEDFAALDEVADRLREAESNVYGLSAENRAQAAVLWSRIMLARGDLTSAISYLEEGAEILIDLEDASIWSHYWLFAINLLQLGWVARSYEAAQTAFHFAMRTGDIALPTSIRMFCERLEEAYPESIS